MNHRPPQWASGVTGMVLLVILIGAYFPSVSNKLVPLGVIAPAGIDHLWTLPAAYPAVGGTISTTVSLAGVLLIVYVCLRLASYIHQDEADRDEQPHPGAPPPAPPPGSSPPPSPPAPPARPQGPPPGTGPDVSPPSP